MKKEYILKGVNPRVTIQEDSKEEFKKMMSWDEETFNNNVNIRDEEEYKPINKNFPSARCQQCGEVTDIQFSWCYRQLVVKIKTFREMLKSANESQRRWLNVKNGQIQAMHKIIAKLIALLTPEQKAKAKMLTQEMRDLIKKAEKNK